MIPGWTWLTDSPPNSGILGPWDQKTLELGNIGPFVMVSLSSFVIWVTESQRKMGPWEQRACKLASNAVFSIIYEVRIHLSKEP